MLSSCVDPAALSQYPPSPSPSSSASASASTPAPTPHNPRKRARNSDITPEERREARAQRNRIAAQSSRDRKKSEFATLQARVAELEAENAALRAGSHHTTPVSRDSQLEERDRENAQLRERILVLEKAWENVASVLQSLGAANVTLSAPPAAPAPANDFPVFSTASSPSPLLSSPTPAPVASAAALSPSSTEEKVDPTRHLARVATVPAPARTSLQRVGSSISTLTTASCALLLPRLRPTPPRIVRLGSTPSSRLKIAYCRERWTAAQPSRRRRR
ncbi:hypothetical protein BOTBODRAFT_207393 [Botryobasidium botryosum FD-172 SS1]|uniref:X-box-binding protein 1 n=1 Tax=Botryobasidium botryosum (strain FD-172 SS1) TaxID=930990 RepID=A0A067N3L5_BOTB1|nr:hypothetical protein BOTBODRAFT_207393 [Botryobasidium botryosum FD-172 SS1]